MDAMAKNKWIFSKEELVNTPTIKRGYDANSELTNRLQAVSFIRFLGEHLHVNLLCMFTAIVYMHRFYMVHSFDMFPLTDIGTVSLFLAGKVEDQCRALKDVVLMANRCMGRTTDTTSATFLGHMNEVKTNETFLLQTLGFETDIDHGLKYIIRGCDSLKVSVEVYRASYLIYRESLIKTTMCLMYKPTVIASFCIHLACKWYNWKIHTSVQNKQMWFHSIDKCVTLKQLETMSMELGPHFLEIKEELENTRIAPPHLARLMQLCINDRRDATPLVKAAVHVRKYLPVETRVNLSVPSMSGQRIKVAMNNDHLDSTLPIQAAVPTRELVDPSLPFMFGESLPSGVAVCPWKLQLISQKATRDVGLSSSNIDFQSKQKLPQNQRELYSTQKNHLLPNKRRCHEIANSSSHGKHQEHSQGQEGHGEHHNKDNEIPPDNSAAYNTLAKIPKATDIEQQWTLQKV